MSSEQVTSQESSNSLFAESEAVGLTFGVFMRLIITLVLVFGGFYLMGSAFGETNYAIEIFMAGLLADVVGFIIAFTALKK